jgi:molybdenum cofactor biosynthesis enzyme MoaA
MTLHSTGSWLELETRSGSRIRNAEAMVTRYFVQDGLSTVERFANRFLKFRTPVPVAPSRAQIQTVSGCNADCVFCPNKKTEIEIPFAKRMDWDLYKKIVDELVALGVRRISPYLMNEPMLDPELPERVAYITGRKKASQYVKINSHGALCNEKMAQRLLDSGIDRINFSIQGIDPDVYHRIMHLKLDAVVKNVERIVELRNRGNYKTRIRVVMLDTAEVHPQLDEIRAFWSSRGVKINLNRLESRGNHSAIESNEIAVTPLEPFDWCDRMFEQVYILWDGRLVQCCADWEQKGVMGDLRTHSLEEIWNGETYRRYRTKFLKGDVCGTICDGCTKDPTDKNSDD